MAKKKRSKVEKIVRAAVIGPGVPLAKRVIPKTASIAKKTFGSLLLASPQKVHAEMKRRHPGPAKKSLLIASGPKVTKEMKRRRKR